ncbi:putative leader peptide [Jiangella mangrovi]
MFDSLLTQRRYVDLMRVAGQLCPQGRVA